MIALVAGERVEQFADATGGGRPLTALHRLLAVALAEDLTTSLQAVVASQPGSFSGSRMVSSRSARTQPGGGEGVVAASWSKVIMLTDFQTTRSRRDECRPRAGVPVDRARNQTRERLFRRELPPIGHANDFRSCMWSVSTVGVMPSQMPRAQP